MYQGYEVSLKIGDVCVCGGGVGVCGGVCVWRQREQGEEFYPAPEILFNPLVFQRYFFKSPLSDLLR